MALGFLLVTVLLPVLALAGLAIDAIRLARGRRAVALRVAAYAWCYLFGETAGLFMYLLLWIASGFGLASRALERWTFVLQRWWCAWLFRSVRVVFRLRLSVEGASEVAAGPFVLLTRHASIIDTLIPAAVAQAPFGIRLRYVFKKELLWDPCLDVATDRVPGVFLSRSGEESEQQIELVRRVARDLTPRDAVLIFPEGTRFTPGKRDRVVAKLRASGDTSLAERAAGLRNVLPPRLGGTLSLLEPSVGADVVICEHTGLEGFATVGDVWNGSLVGSTIRVRLRRFPRSEIPNDPDAQAGWLFDRWSEVDAWISGEPAEPLEPARR
ncbi:MAG TPA: 1-acyl-sn-glycerol-3-phosphate acyltransferase [Actinomycetota bacterium]|nr:1-acyl-sn-glycerol-3-phosphate acyltransferase [Actinomycetota bacterium]